MWKTETVFGGPSSNVSGARPTGPIPKKRLPDATRDRLERLAAQAAFALFAIVLFGGWLVLMKGNGWS